MFVDQLKIAVRNVASDHGKYCYSYRHEKMIDTLKGWITSADSIGVKVMLMELSMVSDKSYTDPVSLEELEKVSKRKSLTQTRFWLIEFVFETQNLLLKPSELIYILD